MTMRLSLMQDTQLASLARHPRPVSELGCILHPHDGPPPDSLVGPMRACQHALYRWDDMFVVHNHLFGSALTTVC